MCIAVCPGCGANLSAPHAVAYTEAYRGHIDPDEGPLVVDAFSVDSSAVCARCGTDTDHTEHTWSNGLGAAGAHVVDWDRREGTGPFVPLWCSCGWLSGAANTEIAAVVAREHESHPPRFEVRRTDARSGLPDLRTGGWLAAANSVEELVDFAEDVSCELCSDVTTGVCIWDTAEQLVAWADGAEPS